MAIRSAVFIGRSSHRLGCKKSHWQEKLSAESTLPVPLYRATCGYGHSGRVRVADHVAGTSALTPAALPAPRALAVTLAGATPCSTQATSGVSMSNWSVLGPAEQCVMPGTRKKRAKLLASPPFAPRSDS